MNGKKFANALFLIIGTCIIISTTTVVAINIFADSKFFEQKAQSEPVGPSPQKETAGKVPEYGTIKYQRDFNTEAQEGSKTNKAKETDGTLRVELINHSGSDTAASKLKDSLEDKGYIVTIIKSATKKSGTTKIIERNEKSSGAGIQKSLKMGVVSKEYKTGYKYDLTLILGLDYNP